MPASPLSCDDLYSDACDNCTVHLPVTEHSAILQRPYKVKERLLAFKKHCSTCVVKLGEVFTVPTTNGAVAVLVQGCALELQIKTCTEAGTSIAVDFHEAWRSHNTTDKLSVQEVRLEFVGTTLMITSSSTIRTKRVLQRLAVVENPRAHGAIVSIGRGPQHAANMAAATPVNGQLWLFSLAPQIVLLAPFCPVLGWVCEACGNHFDLVHDFVRHALANPTLEDSAIKLDYVSASGNVVYTSKANVRYPVRQPTRMKQHAYVGFNYADAVTRLLRLKQKQSFFCRT